MTAPHPLDAAVCPQCDREPGRFASFRRYGGRLICDVCYAAEQAKNDACTCTTTGHCVVCR